MLRAAICWVPTRWARDTHRVLCEPAIHLIIIIIPHCAHFTSSPTYIKENVSLVAPVHISVWHVSLCTSSCLLGTTSPERTGSLGQWRESWNQDPGSSRFYVWAVWPWRSHFTSLDFNVLIYKMSLWTRQLRIPIEGNPLESICSCNLDNRWKSTLRSG